MLALVVAGCPAKQEPFVGATKPIPSGLSGVDALIMELRWVETAALEVSSAPDVTLQLEFDGDTLECLGREIEVRLVSR